MAGVGRSQFLTLPSEEVGIGSQFWKSIPGFISKVKELTFSYSCQFLSLLEGNSGIGNQCQKWIPLFRSIKWWILLKVSNMFWGIKIFFEHFYQIFLNFSKTFPNFQKITKIFQKKYLALWLSHGWQFFPKLLIFPVALDAFTKIPISNFKGNIRKISQNHVKVEEKRVKLC